MPQLDFLYNFYPSQNNSISINWNTLSFIPFLFGDSISWQTVNFAVSNNNSTVEKTLSFYVGIYSLTGSSLSLANSISHTASIPTVPSFNRGWISLTNISATQNITPGNWWFGVFVESSSNSEIALMGFTGPNPANTFPGSFIGGRMTVSTSALPSSYATSDLDTTGSDAMLIPSIILTA